MSARVIAIDYARSRKLREAIDRIMADKPEKQRREFHYHVEVAVALRQVIYEPHDADRAAQREIAPDVARAVRKLHRAAGSVGSRNWELIREGLYLNARHAGIPHAEASKRAAERIAALDDVARNAPAIIDACKAAPRSPKVKSTPTDVLIRDLAFYFAEDFGNRPSASATGQFAQLINEFIGGKRVGSDRLQRLIDACHLTAKAPTVGRKMPSRR